MATEKYDFLVFIGRFQPFHCGHMTVIEHGLKVANQLIVLVGSAHQPRSTRNPWTVEEREEMIRGAFSDSDNKRLHIAPLMDIVYNDKIWVRNVQSTVHGFVTAHYDTPHKKPKIALIGHNKDQTSFYLNLFPQWGSVAIDNVDGISATPLREMYFGVSSEELTKNTDMVNRLESIAPLLPSNVVETLRVFSQKDDFRTIKSEHEFIANYKKSWSGSPYEPTFVTVDAVVIQSGHVLLVERRARPGKGLMALPGGFLEKDEKLLDACLRELKEETKLKVPIPVLKGSLKFSKVFDDPYRSARGRTITHAFYFELEPSNELPKVKGGDDAKKAQWVPLAALDPHDLFEDHYFIVQEILGMY